MVNLYECLHISVCTYTYIYKTIYACRDPRLISGFFSNCLQLNPKLAHTANKGSHLALSSPLFLSSQCWNYRWGAMPIQSLYECWGSKLRLLKTSTSASGAELAAERAHPFVYWCMSFLFISSSVVFLNIIIAQLVSSFSSNN